MRPQLAAVLLALVVVLSVLAPIGTAASGTESAKQLDASIIADHSGTAVAIEQSETTVTAEPGDTVTLTTEFHFSGVAGPGTAVKLPGTWQGELTDPAGGSPKPTNGTANVLEIVWLTPGTYQVTYQIQVPEGAEPGAYHVNVSGSAIDPADAGFISDSTSTTITVEAPPEPADFQVRELNAPETVTQGDPITVSADVTNEGDEAGTQTVAFRLDTDNDGDLEEDETLVSKEITLAGGDTQTVTFEDLDTGSLALGEYDHGIVTEDDSATASITIEAQPDPASFDITSVNAPATTAGDTAQVTVTIENTGDLEGTRTVQLLMDGTVRDDASVSVAGKASKQVTFEVDTSGMAPNEYDFDVVTDDDTSSGTLTVEPSTPDNRPPSADAGNDKRVTEGSTVTLDAGGSSDPDGDDLSYDWTQTAGPTADLEDVDTATPSFDAPNVDEETTLTFELTVSDGKQTASDTVSVTVEDSTETAPEPDPADFRVKNLDAPDSVTNGDSITVSAEITNDGGVKEKQTVGFRLDTDDDGDLEEDETIATREVSLDPGESTTVTFAGVTTDSLSPEEYLHGVFTDDDSATATITIEEQQDQQPSNRAPDADAGDDRTVEAGTSLELDASGSSDPDGDDLSYDWTQIDGPTVDLEDADTATPTFDAPNVDEETTLTFELTVSDGDTHDTETVEVTVNPSETEEESDETYYQVDFVAGEPLEQLGPADSDAFYSDQERLIRYLHGSTDEPVKRVGTTHTLDSAVATCIEEASFTVDDGKVTVTFTVADDCETQLSLVAYEKPVDDWSRELADEQVLVDAETETFAPGTHTITVELPDTDSD
ncbi:PKD domain-containing protein [Halobaculum rarum]|uniref:PKD domain-containing protein n=1 Tax=Halobaculum rarum TaxID=3075122 RepID=UPI0032AF47F7